MIKAILDMGTDGIVVPMICSLKEAEQAAATHYPPRGIRGMGARRAINYGLWDKTDYVANMDRYVLTILQIEQLMWLTICLRSQNCRGSAVLW